MVTKNSAEGNMTMVEVEPTEPAGPEFIPPNLDEMKAALVDVVNGIYELVRMARSKQCTPGDALSSINRLARLVERNVHRGEPFDTCLAPVQEIVAQARADLHSLDPKGLTNRGDV